MTNSNNSSSAQDTQDQIPMSGVNPLYVAIGIAAVVVVGVLVVVGMSLGGDDASGEAAVPGAADDGMTPAERMAAEKQRREHLAITRRSLAKVEADEEEAKAAAPADDEQKKSGAEPAAGSQGGAAPPAAPKPKVSGQAAKKQVDQLDQLGSDIASQLE